MNISKIIFWNTDTQIDFMQKDGNLYVPEAELLNPILKKLTDLAKQKNIIVINTADYHFADSKEISSKPDFKSLFPAHCMADTIGVEFIKETKPENSFVIAWDKVISEINFDNRNYTILKDDFCAFKGNPNTKNFIERLKKEKQIETIVIYGVASNVCVNKAVKALLKFDFKIIIIEDAIKGLNSLADPSKEWKKEKNIKMLSLNEFSKSL